MATHELVARTHIQNFSDGSSYEPHWGYYSRVVPCTNDAGSCAYLDLVYHAHDLSMLYTGIFWSSIGGILLLWAIGRRLFPSRTADETLLLRRDKTESQGLLTAEDNAESQRQGHAIGGLERLKRTTASFRTRYLLPDFAPRILGHVTRLQVLILLVLAGYLLVFSFVGMTYKVWVTPVKKDPSKHNIRTALGPWADRIGVLAYALTPLSVLLASRESVLSLVTGIPYQSFMFLHRWVGYIILIQSSLHTLGWIIVERGLYQPQPSSWTSVASETYIQWGFAALGLLVLLWVFATPLGIRLTGYEFFRKAHYVLAMVYVGAIIGHWKQLDCFLIPGIALWFLDRLARAFRTWMLHYRWIPSEGRWGFESAKARLTSWEDGDGDVVRLDFDHAQQAWEVGQHFFLCFTELSVWQSHPMTPLSVPVVDDAGRVRHSYIIRARKGETKKLAQLAAKKTAEAGDKSGELTTSVVLTGPYGVDILTGLTPETNVLCVAGGTGITFVLPVLLSLVREKRLSGRKVQLIWAVRREVDARWVKEELEEIEEAGCSHGVKVDVFVTREQKNHHHHPPRLNDDAAETGGKTGEKKDEVDGTVASASSSSSTAGGCDCNDATHHHPTNTDVPAERRPHLGDIVRDFVGSAARGPTTVYASGPGGMIGDLRSAVAGVSEAGKVWRGERRGDVRLVCDDRLE